MTNPDDQNPKCSEFRRTELEAKINAAIVQFAKRTVREARDIGFLFNDWKDAVGHNNWMTAYEESGFECSLDTAENWMGLTKLSEEEIDGKSLSDAYRLLREKRRERKAKPAKDKRLADKLVTTDRNTEVRSNAVEGLVTLGIPKRQAEGWVDSVEGASVEEITRNALKAWNRSPEIPSETNNVLTADEADPELDGYQESREIMLREAKNQFKRGIERGVSKEVVKEYIRDIGNEIENTDWADDEAES